MNQKTILFKEYDDAINEQYNYLKNSSGKGVEPGGIIPDELDDIVVWYRLISNNPSWYQELYKANGRKPNNTELRELAESHVRNEYQENGGIFFRGVHHLLKRLMRKLNRKQH